MHTVLALAISCQLALALTPPEAAAQRRLLTPPNPCNVEYDVDYVGNDIQGVSGQYWDCCRLCSGTDGCKAWSWSTHNSGTCWLKSARGEVISKPGVRSGVRVNPSTCPVEDNVDYIGNDIGSASASAATDCCRLCKERNGCSAFSWSNHNGGTCWLKSAKGATSWNPNVKSGVIFTNPQCDSRIEWGVDYIGNDLGNTRANSASECCPICKAWDGCRAFSWTNHNGGTCWLKTKRGIAVDNPDVISSNVNPEPCTLEKRFDYVGNDIGNAPAQKAESCCDICSQRQGCKAFSWTNYNGGTCWLKSARGTIVVNEMAISGTI